MTKREALRLAKAVTGSRLVLGDGYGIDDLPDVTDRDAERATTAEQEWGWSLLRSVGLERPEGSAEACARALGIRPWAGP